MLASLLPALLVLASCSEAAAGTVKESHRLLGALVEVRIESEDADAAHERIREAVAAARRIEAMVDAGASDGAVAALNASAGRGPRAVPDELYRLLLLSQLLNRSTGGAFDVTVGALLLAHQRGRRDGRDMDAALSAVGPERMVLLPPGSVDLSVPGMSIDLGGIARGYALARMAATMREAGVEEALLDLGGSLFLAIGPPPGRPAFRIWIPRGRSTAGSVWLRDAALATARSRRRDARGALQDPRIVDPRSGRFVEADRQATVIALDAGIADAWSHALLVDPDGALQLLREPRGAEALVYDEHGEHRSGGFDAAASWRPGRRPSRSAGDRREQGRPAGLRPVRPDAGAEAGDAGGDGPRVERGADAPHAPGARDHAEETRPRKRGLASDGSER